MEETADDILQRPVPLDEDECDRVKLRIRRRLVGRRLDKYLHSRLPRLSRTLIQRLIKQGAVTVNGRPTKPSHEPDGGDQIEVLIPPPEPTEIIPEPIELNVIYEDRFILAINKQPGIICHPAKGSQTGTLANALAYYAESLSHGADPFRPGIVHRLDKNTTGVMLVAKTDEAHWRLALQFEKRTVEKTYVGVVHGRLEFDEDLISAPIGVHPTIRDRYMVPGARYRQALTKEAVTRYQVVHRFAGHTLVHMHPKTGRTHQLRVHMSYIGYPMVGDKFYGGQMVSERSITGTGSDEPIVDRQALHARRIKFVHPIHEKPVTLEAPIPADIQRLIDVLTGADGQP
ncbi:MAG TPA: RluA family pseudouridine synthase [Phycisphaerae bacterium]|nr:RluA family pseudouridine synthase [Phycisphaerae bacterium]